MRLSDGATLWTASTWRPGAPAVVFLHGGAGLWDYLEPLAALVADVATTHRYDQRGCGRSSPSSDLGTDRFVADLDELRRHLGHRSWTVVGHSFGAQLAIAYAAAHHDAVDAVICVGGVGLDWPAHRIAFGAAKEARLSRVQRARLDELERRDRDRMEEIEWRTLTWLPDFVEPGAESAARAFAEHPFPINLACNAAFNAEAAARTVDEEVALCRRVRAPVLLVHGDADPRPADGPRELAAALPDAEFVLVAGAGHVPWRERPDELRALLRRALAS